MFFPMISGSPMLRPRVPPALRPRFGLLDVLGEPQLVQIAEKSSYPNSRESLLGESPSRETTNDQKTLQFVGRYPVRTGGPTRSGDNTLLLDAGKQVVDAFAQAGKDAWTGYLIGASGMYDTAGDAFGLLNRANDFMTELTGVGQMSEGTIWKDAENWLHKTASQVAPPPEDLPTTLSGKMYAAIGQAPAEVAQLLTAARLAGPIAGIAGLEGVRESENGWEAAGRAAAKGAILGGAAKALDPLNWVARSSGLTSLGAAAGVGEGDDPVDAAVSAVPLGLLGAFGVPRARQKNLLPLEIAYSDFNEAAKHAANRLDVIRGLPQKRQQQLRVQINRTPALLLEKVARRSDDLLGYKTTPGKRYKLPPSPLMRSMRVYDYGRSKWWKRSQDMEVKGENAKLPPEQEIADEYRTNEGARIDYRRENEILRKARIQLGKEGRFDPEARRLAQIIRKRMNRR